MTESANRTCWVCNSSDTRWTLAYNDWQIYRCKDCGFRFAQDGQPLVYDEHYDADYFAPLMQRDQMQKWANTYAERLQYLQLHAPSKRLLEAGAGASTFALNAVSAGFQVNVVDAAPWAVDFLSSNEGISGQLTDLNQCELPPQTYGAIHCSHVLEHLSNPRRFLNQCFHTLQGGGLMYLSFPAYEGSVLRWRDSLYRLGLANHPYNYQAPDHLSYFDAACIRQTLESVGFEVVRLKRIKFVSAYDSVARMDRGGLLRKTVHLASSLMAPVTQRIGFHRDLEIIARRPPAATSATTSTEAAAAAA